AAGCGARVGSATCRPIDAPRREVNRPRGREDLLGAIDQKKAERGKALFNTLCIGCHGPHVASPAIQRRDAPLRKPDEPMWLIRTKELTDVGTDPMAAQNFVNNTVDLRRTGLELPFVRQLLERQLDEQQRRWAAIVPELCQEIARLKAAKAPAETIAGLEPELQVPTGESIARKLDGLDLAKVPAGQALNIIGLVIRDRYYSEHRFTPEQRACYEGFGMLDLPQIVAATNRRRPT